MKLYRVGPPHLHETESYCESGNPCVTVYLASDVDAHIAGMTALENQRTAEWQEALDRGLLSEDVNVELRERIQRLRSTLTVIRGEIVSQSGFRTEYQDWSDAIVAIDTVLLAE